MPSVESLLKLFGRVEYSSSIISLNWRKLDDWMGYALGNQSPSFLNFLPPKKISTDPMIVLKSM